VNGNWWFYTEMHDNCYDDFMRYFNFIDNHCKDCANYTRSTLEGYPVHGCKVDVDFQSLIEKECDKKESKQTTLTDLIGG